jgi:hypothetical protein
LSSLRRVKRGRGGVRSRPSVSGSWSCAAAGGASWSRPGRSGCPGRRAELVAATRPAGTALVTGFVPARAGRLAGTATHLQHLRPPAHAADGDQAREQLVRIGWPRAIIEPGHLVEHPATITSIRFCHRTILPPAVDGVAVMTWRHVSSRGDSDLFLGVWRTGSQPAKAICPMLPGIDVLMLTGSGSPGRGARSREIRREAVIVTRHDRRRQRKVRRISAWRSSGEALAGPG